MLISNLLFKFFDVFSEVGFFKLGEAAILLPVSHCFLTIFMFRSTSNFYLLRPTYNSHCFLTFFMFRSTSNVCVLCLTKNLHCFLTFFMTRSTSDCITLFSFSFHKFMFISIIQSHVEEIVCFVFQTDYLAVYNELIVVNFRRRRWTVGQLGPFIQSYYVIFFCIISFMSGGRLTSPNSLNADSIMELAIADLVSSSWSFLVSFFVMEFICLLLIFSLNTRICDIKSVSVFIASS